MVRKLRVRQKLPNFPHMSIDNKITHWQHETV